MVLNPKKVFDSFSTYLSKFTVQSDVDIEDQFFDRKEIPSSGTNVPKSELNRLKEHIKETVSAFANTNAEGGLLVLGISKTGEILGINHLTDSQRNELSNIGQLLRNQSALVRWEDCTDCNGADNRLLLIYVPPTTDAICETLEANPRAWKRAGAQNLLLTDRDRKQLERDKRIENFERRGSAAYDFSLVDQALLAEIRNTWPGVIGSSLSDEELLYQLGALERTANGTVFTNAGLLFFASSPQRVMPQAHIRILRYESRHDDPNPGAPSLDRSFTGSITTQLLRVREFLRESGLIRVYQTRRKDGGFEENPELPFFAVDEAIVNAVVHRDYALEWPIECRYYQDALEVRSPGRIIQRNGTVPAAFRLDERTLQHAPRNPLLLDWLKQTRDQKGQLFVRALSEGTRAMLQAMTEMNLPPPEYEVSDAETLVRLRIKTVAREQPAGRASEFANLYALVSSSALPKDWKSLALSTLRDRLVATGWFVDHISHGRICAHQRAKECPLPAAVRAVVRLYPAYVFTFRYLQGRPYLVLDYTVEVKSVLNLAQLQKRGEDITAFIGRRATAKLTDGWRDARIDSIGVGNAKVSAFDMNRSETVSLEVIIPSLGLKEIREQLADLNFDPSTEIKHRSLATETGAARKRAEITQMAAEDIARTVFPLRVGGTDIQLSVKPARLDPTSRLTPRSLAEPLVEFSRHRETSNIREGITEFGAYSQEQKEIELVPIVAETHRSEMQNLIERLKSGKYKYKGSERTFSTRFTYGSIISLHSGDDLIGTCRRVLREHPTWAGDSSLSRLFLVHASEAGFSLDDEHSPYYEVKRVLLEAGIPCQMVDTPTLEDPDWKDLNLALNIVAKCGVVPWVLPEGMPGADFFIGLSYTQHRGDPGTRLMGYANVFNKYGRWLFYSGNTQTFDYRERGLRLAELVASTLRRVDNLSETPHIYFHYSARFSSDDREALVEAARSIRPHGTYSFVWINAHHPIRLYDERPESDGSLARGTYIVTSENQLYLSTTGYNPYRKTLGTPHPLEITVWTYPPVGHTRTPPDLHSLARQILALTKLNWASSDALTGEPITTKYAGDIAYLTAAFMRQGQPFRLHPVLEQTPWFL